MWLPTPIYRRIPLLLLVVGALLMSAGVYLGFVFTLPLFYFGVGCISALWGAFLFLMRSERRGNPAQQMDSEQG